MLRAAHYVHSEGFMHRAMKPENFLLVDTVDDLADGVVKLVDFDMVRVNFGEGSKDRQNLGDPGYLPPEVDTKSIYGKAGYGSGIDVWAIGVICYFLMTGKMPIQGMSKLEVQKNVNLERVDWNALSSVSSNGKGAVKTMLTFDPAARPSAGQVLKEKWFSAMVEEKE